jgi:hypothetical protein
MANQMTHNLAAQGKESCIIELGDVSAQVTRQELETLVMAYREIVSHPSMGKRELIPSGIRDKSWVGIGWHGTKRYFSLNLRGIAWTVNETEMHRFIKKEAIPLVGERV